MHVTDVTNASRTLLFNLKTLQWDQTLLDLFGVPRAMLPLIKTSSEVYCVGATAAAADGDCSGGGNDGNGDGCLAGVKIAGILGDQHAALVGQASRKGLRRKCWLTFVVGQASRKKWTRLVGRGFPDSKKYNAPHQTTNKHITNHQSPTQLPLDVFRARGCEMHLWHRLLHYDEHGPETDAVHQRPLDDGELG